MSSVQEEIFLRLLTRCFNNAINTAFHALFLLKQQEGEGYFYLSRDVRKPDFCICENKDADQLHGNREADQRLCFRYTDSTIPLLPKSEISSP